jgi:hypothetical protein
LKKINALKILKLISFLVLITLIFSCKEELKKPLLLDDPRDSSTIKMAEQLAMIYRAIPPMGSNYKNASRAQYLFEQAQGKDIGTKLTLEIRAAYENLLAGNTEEALEEYTRLIAACEAIEFPNKQSVLTELSAQNALAFIRLGEQENCIVNHNASSCIFPLVEEAVHKSRRGSENAIRIYTDLLQNDPNNLTYKWLLNIAYMTLGAYPQEVPKQYLLPLMHPENEHIPRFKNIASYIGIDDNRLSGGIIIDDFNNDGFYDLVVSSWNLNDQLFIYFNNGNGTFTESHKKAGLEGITGGLYINHTDYNNDGYLDIFIPRGAWLGVDEFPNSLLRNNGDGTFTDVTIEANIFSKRPSQAVVWADFNNDGWVDCFKANERGEKVYHPAELFLNNGNGTFTEVGAQVNAQIQIFSKGAATADYDNDGDQDIFISNFEGDNVLLRNDTTTDNEFGFSFTNVAEQAGILNPQGSFPCWFFDFNNDGWDDIFVSGYSSTNYNKLSQEYAAELLNLPFTSEVPRLYLNKKDGTFKDVTKSYKVNTLMFAMGADFGDLNNDGYLDFYVSTGEPNYNALLPNRMFLNVDGNYFDEVTRQGGFGHVQKGHAVSFADLDNDGDQDIYGVMGGAYEGDVFFNTFFENPISDNNWVKIKLQGTKSNQVGFGSKLKIKFIENGKERTVYRTISSGSSFGENPFVQEIGIGKATVVSNLEINWPSGQIQQFSNVLPNKKYLAMEGDTALKILEHKTIKFNSEGPLQHNHLNN